MNITNSETSSSTATFCAGRYALDVPVGSRLSGGNYIYKFTQLEKPEQVSLQSFEAAIAEKEKALKAMKHEIEPSLLRLSLRPDTHSHILVFWEEDFAEAIAEVEGYRWIDGIRFVIKGRAGMSKPSHGTISRQDIVINRMREILAHLRPRSDGEIPSEPGYCFEGGFIASPKWGNEEAGIDIDIAGHPDAFISVWFYPLAMSKHDRPLLERMGGVLQSLGRLATSVRVLRSGDRQVGPYRGQEHLATAPSSGGMRGHSFIWETEGQGTFETPALKIELTTGHRDKDGNPQKTRLTDEQAMKLWDEVLNSFRVRPTTDPQKTSQNNPPSSPLRPLGELAGTGSTCPQNGWWRCVDTGNVAGGRRRFFKAGEKMPSVVLLGPPNLWQALRKKPPTYETKTVWTLVDYEEGVDVPSAETGTDGVNADTQSRGKS
ncbi:T6SS immunity protein Tli4 family protein [Herbaspirillum sp. C7C2]|uniref:T6SS immunity protein Tli4 family protein n=1 Tax=Herbaspirillum sp. C7C2 TaxID=2736666 RepID=UPI001F5206B2|nr:T6SS immunity protein Tli4 family protein [Herbaspirillum sp. C7C2]